MTVEPILLPTEKCKPGRIHRVPFKVIVCDVWLREARNPPRSAAMALNDQALLSPPV